MRTCLFSCSCSYGVLAFFWLPGAVLFLRTDASRASKLSSLSASASPSAMPMHIVMFGLCHSAARCMRRRHAQTGILCYILRQHSISCCEVLIRVTLADEFVVYLPGIPAQSPCARVTICGLLLC